MIEEHVGVGECWGQDTYGFVGPVIDGTEDKMEEG